MIYLLIPVGLAIGLVLPRWRLTSLMFLAWATSGYVVLLLALKGVPGLRAMPIWMAAAVLAGVPLVITVLARLFPRVMLAILVFFALAVPLTGTLMVDWLRGPWVFVYLGITIAIAVVSALSVPLGVRVLAACIATPLVLLPFGAHYWTRPLLFIGIAAFTLLSAFLMPRKRMIPPSTGWLAAGLVLATAAVAWLVISLPRLAEHPTEPAQQPYAHRVEALRKVAPAGGLLWTFPTEEMTFEGHTRLPWAENLDALYLFGHQGWLVAVPGTTSFGQFVVDDEVAKMRVIKEPEELEALRQAARATVDSLKELLPLYRAGTTEAELDSKLAEHFKQHGCEEVSFPLIIATGPGAAKPHQFALDQTLKDGQLVVSDIGCYRNHYASDFTRTLPVGGKFTPELRKLYDAVYAAQQAALAACKPGMSLYGPGADGTAPDGGNAKSLMQITRDTLKEHGVDPKYPHGVGHTVGLYVHDSGNPHATLKPGMVITIEPGLYVPGKLGIRIEDTYLVTDGGCEPLTSGFPAASEDVERLMAGGAGGSGSPGGGVPDAGLPDGGALPEPIGAGHGI